MSYKQHVGIDPRPKPHADELDPEAVGKRRRASGLAMEEHRALGQHLLRVHDFNPFRYVLQGAIGEQPDAVAMIECGTQAKPVDGVQAIPDPQAVELRQIAWH